MINFEVKGAIFDVDDTLLDDKPEIIGLKRKIPSIMSTQGTFRSMRNRWRARQLTVSLPCIPRRRTH